MKNNFPKIAFTVVLALFVIPQVTFAAWWNPFTWSIFHRAEIKTETVENKPDSNATTTISTSTSKDVITTTTKEVKPPVKQETKKTTPVVDNSAIIQAQVKAQVEAQLKIKAEQDALIAKQKADEQARLDALKAEADKRAAEEEAIQKEKQKITTLDVGEITCTQRPAGTYYILPFTVGGEWVSGWVQVKITDENGGVVTKGFDLDKSNIDEGFVFGMTGAVRDSYGGSRNVELKAGLSATYKINIHSVVPSYTRQGIRSYSFSSLIAEESGTFKLPNCSR